MIKKTLNASWFLYFFLMGRLRLKLYDIHPKYYQFIFLKLTINKINKTFKFYQKINSLKNIPVMNKKLFLENFSELNRFNLSYEECLKKGLTQEVSRVFKAEKEGYTIGLSSGTSGQRGIFLTTEREQIRWSASLFNHLSWFSFFKKYKIAFFLRANSPMYEKVSRSKRINFKFFDLLISLDKLTREILAYQPTVIVAPSYILNEILTLKINNPNVLTSVKIIVSVADVLDKDLENKLRSIFQCPIHQIYQATEGFLATTCSHEKIHLNEDLIFFEEELIDKNSNRFSPILTDYFRETQAIIRYRLDDILVFDNSPCPCGTKRRALLKIEGRSDEILEYCNIKIFPDYLRNAIQNSLDKSIDFCLIKGPVDLQLTVKLGCPNDHELEARIRENLSKLWAQLNLTNIDVIIEYNFQRDLSQKRKRVFNS